MPELPEVETTKKGIKPHIVGQKIRHIIVRNHRLRIPVPLHISELCAEKEIKMITRRAKYLLLHLSKGYILIHLGMSGHLRIIPTHTPAEKHDHIDLIMANGLNLRYCDPRRFGTFIYLEENPLGHFLLSQLGPEPLSQEFNGNYLFEKTRNKTQAIKSLIMTNQIVVGIGNIYAAESLFVSGIHPAIPAKKLTLEQLNILTNHIKEILEAAIKAGGTTLRDFYTFDGKPGYFSISLKVYGRKNQPCYQCKQVIDTIVLAGRHSPFCPQCQPEAI